MNRTIRGHKKVHPKGFIVCLLKRWQRSNQIIKKKSFSVSNRQVYNFRSVPLSPGERCSRRQRCLGHICRHPGTRPPSRHERHAVEAGLPLLDTSLGPGCAAAAARIEQHARCVQHCFSLRVCRRLKAQQRQQPCGLSPTNRAHQQVVEELVALALVAAQVRLRQARRQPLRRARQVHHLSAGVFVLFLHTRRLFRVSRTGACPQSPVAARFPTAVARCVILHVERHALGQCEMLSATSAAACSRPGWGIQV